MLWRARRIGLGLVMERDCSRAVFSRWAFARNLPRAEEPASRWAELVAASERVRPIWRTGLACSLGLAGLLQEPTTERLTALAAELAAELLADVPAGLFAAPAGRQRPKQQADFVS